MKKGSKKTKKTGYIILPAIPFGARITLISILILGGLGIQLLLSMILPGIIMVFAGSLLSMQRALSTKLSYKKRAKPEWKTVSLEKWTRIEELKKSCKKWQSSIGNVNSVPGALFLIALIIVCFVVFIVFVDEDDAMFLVIIGNILALYIPLLTSGSLLAWVPPEIGIKLKALNNILDAFKESGMDEIEVKPMLGLVPVKSKKGRIPVDAKMMIKFKDASKGFYGVQVQCSLNDVSGSKYPYLYCVILCSPDYKIDPGKLPRPKTRDIIFEPSQSAEAKLLVIRLRTTKTSGYHTDAKTQVRIVRTALEVASNAL